MREILFRGKRIKDGEWVFGLPFRDRPSGEIDGIEDDNGGLHHVYPDTISEFTGLSDKNGKKIFEGDIIRFEERIYVCCWCASNVEFMLSNHEESFGMGYVHPCELEVISNIHDNPELLEGENETD